jgi:hypothetical protein
MKVVNVLRALMTLLFLGGVAFAQGTGASGDLVGTVTDQSGAVVANGTVTATDVGRGTTRTAATSSDGRYAILGLPPSVYSVSTSKSGFATAIAKSVAVVIGQTTTLDFQMKVSQVTESVEVTTEVPVIETERGHQADVINQQLIQDLPINRRDYLTFTLLAPGVADSTRMASDQDFRVKQTPQSGLSFYGSNGRGNSVTVDSGEANDDSGGVRLTVGQEAVREFQINRSNYGADLGGASGASINIVTKSGTNDVHGSLFSFFRNDAMDARNPFAVSQALAPGQPFNPAAPDVTGKQIKDSLTRAQFGGSVGFPVIKDKGWLFTGAEGLVQDAQNAVPLLTSTSVLRPDNGKFSGNNQTAIINGLASLSGNPSVPCLTGQPALPAATCAGILTNILTLNSVSPLPKFLVNQLESNGGLFNYNTRLYQIFARYDHQFNANNQAILSYSFNHDQEQNPDVQSLIGFSAGSSVKAFDHNIQGSWFHQFSPRTLNDTRIQWNYTDFNVIPNQPGQVGLAIPGFANLGTNIFLPNFTIMRRPEVANNTTLIRGNHTMKFGQYFLYRGNHTESHTFFPGRFVFGNLPGGVLSPCLQVPAACGLAPASASTCQFANGAFPTPPAGQFCFPAAINGLQSASLGLPQFYQQGFGNPIYSYPRPLAAFYWQDQWKMRSNFTLTFGLRYELDAQYGQLHTDKDNFAPRVSFAWDPGGDHKTVVRGGFGIYYSPIYGQIADVVQTLGLVNGVRPIAQTFVPLTGAPGNPALTSALIFQTLFAQGLVQCTTPAPAQPACITPANLTQFGINVTNTGPVPPLTVLFSGQPDYQSPYSEQASFGIERQISKGFSIGVSGIYVHTMRMPVAIDINLLPTAPTVTGTSPFNGQQVKFQAWNAPQCGANPLSCFANPLILQSNQYSSLASALFEGGIFEVTKRFSDNFTLFGNYTYSKAYSTTTDFNSDFAPFNQLNLAAERGLSDFDQRHKVVVAAVFSGTHKGFLSGFQLSPVVKYSSEHPYNILAAGTDINGDRHSTNDRPLGVARNSGRGPDYSDVDLRLSKSFKIMEKTQIQLVAEAFNLFNRTNFASVNNALSTVNGFAPPPLSAGRPQGRFLDPTTINPGGAAGDFTSIYNNTFTPGGRRQLQFGARFTF